MASRVLRSKPRQRSLKEEDLETIVYSKLDNNALSPYTPRCDAATECSQYFDLLADAHKHKTS